MKHIFLFALFSSSIFAQTNLTLNVSLTPAGSFQATSSKVKGRLIKKDGAFTAKKLTVLIETLKTGIDLRDEHMWKHLNSKKNTKAVLTDLKAQNGKGSAQLEVNGIKKPVSLAYSETATEVVSTFKVRASDFALPPAKYLGVGVDDTVSVEAKLPFKNK